MLYVSCRSRFCDFVVELTYTEFEGFVCSVITVTCQSLYVYLGHVSVNLIVMEFSAASAYWS